MEDEVVECVARGGAAVFGPPLSRRAMRRVWSTPHPGVRRKRAPSVPSQPL